jgi:hypothetical protein
MEDDFLMTFDSLMYNAVPIRQSGEENHTDFEYERCRNALANDIAIVSIEIATESLLRSVRDQRISFVGQIANLGNINIKIMPVSLCCG